MNLRPAGYEKLFFYMSEGLNLCRRDQERDKSSTVESCTPFFASAIEGQISPQREMRAVIQLFLYHRFMSGYTILFPIDKREGV
jgi:hypothetical protein